MVRQKKVDQQSRQVGQAHRQLAGILQDQAALEEKIHEILQAPSSEVFTDPQELLARRQWLDHLDQCRSRLKEKEDQSRQNWEKERAVLTQAWRDLDMLKKLKQRQKDGWLSEQARRESRELDEIGQLRADQARREKLAMSREQHSLRQESPGSRAR